MLATIKTMKIITIIIFSNPVGEIFFYIYMVTFVLDIQMCFIMLYDCNLHTEIIFELRHLGVIYNVFNSSCAFE